MTHDPLCPVLSPQRWDHYPFSCCCEFIAKVREDTLAKCIAVIEAIPTICDDLDWPYLDLTVPEIISEIKAEKP
jgi:hypothetical protein